MSLWKKWRLNIKLYRSSTKRSGKESLLKMTLSSVRNDDRKKETSQGNQVILFWVRTEERKMREREKTKVPIIVNRVSCLVPPPLPIYIYLSPSLSLSFPLPLSLFPFNTSLPLCSRSSYVSSLLDGHLSCIPEDSINWIGAGQTLFGTGSSSSLALLRTSTYEKKERRRLGKRGKRLGNDGKELLSPKEGDRTDFILGRAHYIYFGSIEREKEEREREKTGTLLVPEKRFPSSSFLFVSLFSPTLTFTLIFSFPLSLNFSHFSPFGPWSVEYLSTHPSFLPFY